MAQIAHMHNTPSYTQGAHTSTNTTTLSPHTHSTYAYLSSYDERHKTDGADDGEENDGRDEVARLDLVGFALGQQVHRLDDPRQAQAEEDVHAVAACSVRVMYVNQLMNQQTRPQSCDYPLDQVRDIFYIQQRSCTLCTAHAQKGKYKTSFHVHV